MTERDKKRLQELVQELERGATLCVSIGMGGYDLPEETNEILIEVIKKAIQEG